MKTHVLFHGDYATSPGAVSHEIELPRGYYRVWDGALKPGDLSLNRLQAPEVVTWGPITMPTDKDIRNREPYSNASWFGCVIRVGSQVREACARCLCAPRGLKNKFCRHCCQEVILNHRAFSSDG